jgi:hypothetical protein
MLSEEAIHRARNTFIKNKYAEVPEMVSPEISKLLYDYGHLLRVRPAKYLTADESNSALLGKKDGNRSKHGVQISELLLLYFKADFEKIIGKKLVPTYSFTRKYVRGSILARHSDRPSCQYSITLNITASDENPWPFFCQEKTIQTISKINNLLHVPIIYMGEEVFHWREPLNKNFSFHVFLHYVDADDSNYKNFWYDGRKYFG